MLRSVFLYVVSLCQRRSSLPTRRDENEEDDAPRLVVEPIVLPEWFQRNVRARLNWARATRLVRLVLRLRKRWSYFGALLNTRRNLPQPILNNVRRYFSRLGRTLRSLNSTQLCDHLERKSGVLKHKARPLSTQ